MLTRRGEGHAEIFGFQSFLCCHTLSAGCVRVKQTVCLDRETIEAIGLERGNEEGGNWIINFYP